MTRMRWAALAVLALGLSGCGLLRLGEATVQEPVATPGAVASHVPGASLATTGATTATVSVAVVGDLDCRVLCPRSTDVAALVESLRPDAFLPPGDLLNNTADWSVYDEDWGGLKDITSPIVGNHEYSAGIEAYDAYWGDAAHAPDHYYAMDLGSWRIVALNSEIDAARGSVQETWFRAELAARPAACTMVMIHGPRWSSSTDHPSDDSLQALWDAAVGGGAELWVAGHAHLYERFTALDSDGLPFDEGTTQFVIGTGGRQLHRFARESLTGEVVRDNETFGAGLFTLGDGTWSMRFVPVPGQSFQDATSGTCH